MDEGTGPLRSYSQQA